MFENINLLVEGLAGSQVVKTKPNRKGFIKDVIRDSIVYASSVLILYIIAIGIELWIN